MTAPLILILLLLCFLAFFLWDRKRLSNPAVRPLPREQMEKGFTPAAVLGWPVWIGLGLISVTLAIAEWQSPSRPPYSGRWAWFNEAIYQAFGPNGNAGFFLVLGFVGIGYGLIRWRRSR